MQLVLLLGLGALLTAFVAYGMSLLQHSQNTGFLGWLTSKAAALPIIGPFSAQQVLKLDQWITHYIGQHFAAVKDRSIAWIVGLKQYVGYMAGSSLAPAIALYTFAQWLLSIAMPKTIDARTADTRAKALRADANAEAAMKEAVALAHAGKPLPAVREVPIIQRVAMPHAEEWTWINQHWAQLRTAVLHAAALPIAHVLPKVEPIAWPYGLTPTGIRRRLHRVEALLGVSAFAIAMARVLNVTPRCLRSGNVGKVARRLCGLPSHVLDDLLGLLVDVLIVEDICQVVKLLESGLQIIQGPIDTLVGAVGGSLCHGDYDAPPNIGPFTLSTPPVVGYTLS